MSQFTQEPDVLQALVRIGNIFNTERDLDRLLSVIVEEAYRLLDAELGSLFLLDEEKGELWSKVSTDLGEGKVIRIPRGQGVVGHVVETALPLIVPDAYADDRFNRTIDKATGFRTRNILCTPITTVHGQTVGAFQVLNKNGEFDQHDIEILQMVGSQACIAIENANLYRELQDSRDELREENVTLKRHLKGKYAYPTIIGVSPAIQHINEIVKKVASSNASVLISFSNSVFI